MRFPVDSINKLVNEYEIMQNWFSITVIRNKLKKFTEIIYSNECNKINAI